MTKCILKNTLVVNRNLHCFKNNIFWDLQCENVAFTSFIVNLKPLNNALTLDLTVYHLVLMFFDRYLCCWSTGLNKREYPWNILQACKCMPIKHEGLGQQLFFINIAVTGRTEFNTSKGNALTYFNVIINNKCQISPSK